MHKNASLSIKSTINIFYSLLSVFIKLQNNSPYLSSRVLTCSKLWVDW